MKILLFYLAGYVISIILMSYIIRKRQIYTTSSQILKIPFHALFSWFLVFWIVAPKILEKMDKYYFKIKIYGKREKEKTGH